MPSDWTVVVTGRAGPFVTWAHLRRPDGRLVEWRSRAHRKRLGLGGDEASTGQRVRRRPAASCWWMAGLFAGGSVCFALGSLPWFFNAVAPAVVAATFFGGSILFTSASMIAYDESRAAPPGLGPDATRRPIVRRLLGASPEGLGWWAAAVQLVGTLLFNLSTFAATQSTLDLQEARRLIWAPDLFGSVCFLVARLAGLRRGQPRASATPGRLDRLAHRRAEPGWVGRLRCRCDRGPLPGDHGRPGQHHARQPRHLRRRGLLPRRSHPPPGRGGRRGTGTGTDAKQLSTPIVERRPSWRPV